MFRPEAKALAFVGRVARHLQIQRAAFLTDNQVLATVASSRCLNHPLMYWNSRDEIADFLSATSTLPTQVHHIKRGFNEVANNSAKQVLRHSLNQPIFSCKCSAHREADCPVISSLQSFHKQDYVLNAVFCS